MVKKINIFLILVIFLGFFLRFYQLGVNPAVFNRDEAAIGYNAYTILTTGRDEFGIKLPLAFRSFGDYKMPLYIYLVVPYFKLFGVNEFAVRFPSAFFGSLTILLIYLLVFVISKNKKTALISALLLAITPFHIHYSRLAFEANVALFLFFFGIYLFIAGLKKSLLLIFSSIAFTLSLFCYFTPYFLILPFILILTFFYYREVRGQKNKAFFILFMIMTIIGFLVALKTTIMANQAKTNITIFKDQKIWEEMAKSRAEHGVNQGLLLKLYDNKYLFYGKEFLRNYLLSFSSDFLFFRGGNHPWHRIPQIGNLYLIDLLFLILGVYAIFKKGNLKEYLFPAFFLLSPIPSAITTDAPHTTRLLTFFIIFLILSAYGITFILEKVKFKKMAVLLISFIYLYSFGFFLQAYFIHFPKDISTLWLPGIKNKVLDVLSNKDKYSKVIINDNGESYIYLLFYGKYPLEKYLETVKLKKDNQGFVHIFSFDNYEFRTLNEGDFKNNKLLIINPY